MNLTTQDLTFRDTHEFRRYSTIVKTKDIIATFTVTLESRADDDSIEIVFKGRCENHEAIVSHIQVPFEYETIRDLIPKGEKYKLEDERTILVDNHLVAERIMNAIATDLNDDQKLVDIINEFSLQGQADPQTRDP